MGMRLKISHTKKLAPNMARDITGALHSLPAIATLYMRMHTPYKNKKHPAGVFFVLAERVGFARPRAERWSALTATGSHSLPTLRIPLTNSYKKRQPPNR
jgi:hypothetical protein